MKKATRNILLAVCFAAVILPMLAGKPSAADKRKAEYAFMEAISKKEAGDIDAAYALLRHAVTLDPDNPTINYYVGFTMLNLDRTTTKTKYTPFSTLRSATMPKRHACWRTWQKDIRQRPSCSLCSQKVMRHKATSTRPSPLSTAWRRLRDGR